jgi:excisionase family DNA binding protein
MDELLSVQEVAAYCRVHERTIRRHIASGRLASVRVGRAVRVKRSELAVFTDVAAAKSASTSGLRVAPKSGIIGDDDPILGLIGMIEDEPWVSANKHHVLYGAPRIDLPA